MDGRGVEGAIPDFDELLEGELASQPPGDVKMPVARRHAAFLPVVPAGILFQGGPDFFGGERDAVGQAGHGAGDVHANEHAADVEDDRPEFGSGHDLEEHRKNFNTEDTEFGAQRARRTHRLGSLFLGLRKGSGTAGAVIVASTKREEWERFAFLNVATRELAAGAEDADDGGQDGKNDYHCDHVVDALGDVGNQMAERIAAEDHGADPEDAAENIECQVTPVGHVRCACDRRAKRANDGNEARENHGAAAVFFVKIVRALQMAAPEEERIFAPVKRCSRRAPDPVTDLIAHDGAEHHGKEEQLQRNYASGRENAGGDKKGISWKKEADEKPSFDKNDRADKGRATCAD